MLRAIRDLKLRGWRTRPNMMGFPSLKVHKNKKGAGTEARPYRPLQLLSYPNLGPSQFPPSNLRRDPASLASETIMDRDDTNISDRQPGPQSWRRPGSRFPVARGRKNLYFSLFFSTFLYFSLLYYPLLHLS